MINNSYYNFNENNNVSEDFNQYETNTLLNQYDANMVTTQVGNNLIQLTNDFNQQDNSRNNINNVEPFENTIYELYSNADFNTNSNNSEHTNLNNSEHNDLINQNSTIERYDSTKMSKYVNILTKKIPSAKTSANLPTKSANLPTKSANSSTKLSSISDIKRLSIDMGPYLYKYKKYKKSSKSKRSSKSKKCKNKFIINRIFIKKNIILICECMVYILLLVLLFYLFKRN